MLTPRKLRDAQDFRQLQEKAVASCADSRCAARVARLLGERGAYALAACYMRQALAVDPDQPEYLSALGVYLARVGRYDEAYFHLKRALVLAPNEAQFHVNLGIGLICGKEIDLALLEFQRALELAPRSWRALACAAEACFLRSDFEAAYRYGRTAAANNGGAHGPTVATLARAAVHCGRLREALRYSRQCLDADPVQGRYVLSLNLAYGGRYREAIRTAREALALQPDSALLHFQLAWCLLSTGRFREGWDEYEWRLKMPGHEREAHKFLSAPPAEPPWRGEALEGRTILVHGEQGYGDMIFFARYIEPLLVRRARVILLAAGALVPLFRQALPETLVVPYMSPIPRYDYHVPIGSLARVFCPEVPPLAAQQPYLARAVPHSPSLRGLSRRGKGIVGVAWGGNHLGPEDRRAVPFEVFRRFFQTQGVTFVSLQRDDRKVEPVMSKSAIEVRDESQAMSDFLATAELVRGLDLLVTVDTGLAHLAGAMGVETWLLLPYAADWRWFANDRRSPHFERSPWYPSMRLFRQSAPGDWVSVMQRVRRELAAKARRTWGRCRVAPRKVGSECAPGRRGEDSHGDHN